MLSRWDSLRAVMLVVVTLMAIPFVLVACGGFDDDEPATATVETAGSDAASVGDLVIANVWSRPVVLLDGGSEHEHDADATAGHTHEMDHEAVGTNGVVYMRIENSGESADRLIGATSEIAATLEFHNVNMVEGVMQMRQVDGGIEIPAGETVLFEQGGYHLMLIGLHEALEVGDRFALQITFENAGTVNVESEVRAG